MASAVEELLARIPHPGVVTNEWVTGMVASLAGVLGVRVGTFVVFSCLPDAHDLVVFLGDGSLRKYEVLHVCRSLGVR